MEKGRHIIWTGCRVSPIVWPSPASMETGASFLTVSSYCSSWEQFHWLHVRETWPYWSHTAWRKQRERTGCGQKKNCIYVFSTSLHRKHIILTFMTDICVRLCTSLYITVEYLVPGSSWSLSSTWCTHAHHPFGSQDGSSWWFCCSKLSHSCNRWQKLVFGRDSIIDISVLLKIFITACFIYFSIFI